MLYFSLQNVCLARVTTRFLLIFKYLSITCCHGNKQIKIDGKNDSCVTKECKLLYLSCDAKDCKHCCCQANNQIKTGGKNNPFVTKECKLLYLSCDAKDCKHYTYPFKIYKSSVKESRRLRTKCDWLQWVICCRQQS